MGDELIQKEMGFSIIMDKRVPRGNYPCILIQPIFPKFDLCI
jgi:hypothetical protein